MAVTGFGFHLGAAGDFTSAIGRQCEHCGARIEADPAIAWAQATGHRFYHRECALTFHLAFGRDLHELRKFDEMRQRERDDRR